MDKVELRGVPGADRENCEVCNSRLMEEAVAFDRLFREDIMQALD